MKKSFDYTKVSLPLGLLIVIIGFFSITQLFFLQSSVDAQLLAVEEAARPPALEMYILSDVNCSLCSDLSSVIRAVREGDVNITREENIDVSSLRAQELITTYSLGRVPAIVVRGELEKTTLETFERVNDAYVFMQEMPPYTDTATGQVRGLVTATLLKDSSCDVCVAFDGFMNQLEKTGITIVSAQEYERTSVEGRRIIQRYDISAVPTIIFSGELRAYGSAIDKQWVQIGSKESDGSYVVRALTPPYVNTSTGDVWGLVTATILVDKDCVDCFDAEKFNLPILQRLGLIPSKIKTVDVQSEQGKKLIATYALEKAPTVVLTGDMGSYHVLTAAWSEVGTVESDGAYVFRNVEIGKRPYRNLTSGLIVTPAANS